MMTSHSYIGSLDPPSRPLTSNQHFATRTMLKPNSGGEAAMREWEFVGALGLLAVGLLVGLSLGAAWLP